MHQCMGILAYFDSFTFNTLGDGHNWIQNAPIVEGDVTF